MRARIATRAILCDRVLRWVVWEWGRTAFFCLAGECLEVVRSVEAVAGGALFYTQLFCQPPSQTWRTFLDNHLPDLAAIDFFTAPTATFRVPYCFVVLRHHRREVVHFNVTADPSAEWTAQQIIEAFPYEEAARCLMRAI